MDDRLTVDSPNDPYWYGDALAFADGGRGNDRLVGGGGQDELRGGGGVDDLTGGDGDDRLIDGDADGAVGTAGPGPDRFDGGAGTDTVSYAQRTAPVSADIAAGEGADGDRFANVESLTGGRGDDRLAGDGLPNVLDGHRGQDQLSGRGGSDEFRGAGGPASCGEQEDTVIGGNSSRDRLEPDCEFIAPNNDTAVRANPVGRFAGRSGSESIADTPKKIQSAGPAGRGRCASARSPASDGSSHRCTYRRRLGAAVHGRRPHARRPATREPQERRVGAGAARGLLPRGSGTALDDPPKGPALS